MSAKLMLVILAFGLLTACGNQGPSDDQLATSVAEAIAATQAIERQVATSLAASATAGAPTATTSASAAETATLPAPVAPATTLSSPTSTAAPSNTPADLVPLPTDTPTPTPPPVAVVFPFGGFTQGVEGAVMLPGYTEAPAPPEVFRDTLSFRVDAFDPAAGDASGDGIEQVSFRVQELDADGNIFEVYERTEMNAPYCLVGGDDPACNPIDLVEGAVWPNGAPFVSGRDHVEIAIVGSNPETQAFWNFEFLVELR